ncbi:MAG: hypothetical protein QOJ29_5467 [Thermoleophilaceae bacterium]|nr:hypothetical protein [Thermoleophilaceae bacterium]
MPTARTEPATRPPAHAACEANPAPSFREPRPRPRSAGARAPSRPSQAPPQSRSPDPPAARPRTPAAARASPHTRGNDSAPPAASRSARPIAPAADTNPTAPTARHTAGSARRPTAPGRRPRAASLPPAHPARLRSPMAQARGPLVSAKKRGASSFPPRILAPPDPHHRQARARWLGSRDSSGLRPSSPRDPNHRASPLPPTTPSSTPMTPHSVYIVKRSGALQRGAPRHARPARGRGGPWGGAMVAGVPWERRWTMTVRRGGSHASDHLAGVALSSDLSRPDDEATRSVVCDLNADLAGCHEAAKWTEG